MISSTFPPLQKPLPAPVRMTILRIGPEVKILWEKFTDFGNDRHLYICRVKENDTYKRSEEEILDTCFDGLNKQELKINFRLENQA